jgi:hypothetical protein
VPNPHAERPHFDGERRDLRCPEPGCGALMRLRVGPTGPFYGCVRHPECPGSHRAHANGIPWSGAPVPKATRDLQRLVHQGVLAQTRGARGRVSLYAWLRAQIGVSRALELRHWSAVECEKALAALERRRGA